MMYRWVVCFLAAQCFGFSPSGHKQSERESLGFTKIHDIPSWCAAIFDVTVNSNIGIKACFVMHLFWCVNHDIIFTTGRDNIARVMRGDL